MTMEIHLANIGIAHSPVQHLAAIEHATHDRRRCTKNSPRLYVFMDVGFHVNHPCREGKFHSFTVIGKSLVMRALTL